ncbi:MAG: acetolactate decarboxylase [Selenomonadaceae bacterium]|nr:acetolactate decarboxylase [Selenomonadaceae bacterium]
MKKFFVAIVLTALMLINTAVTSAAPVKEKNTLYQVALLQSLALGHFDGSISVKDLKKLGDTGIGTFEGLDGELIAVNGVIYRANNDCKINVVPDNVKIPFCNVTFFKKDFSSQLVNLHSKSSIEEELNKFVEEHGVNNFYMVRIHGTFNDLLVRSEAKQSKPYPTLVGALEATQKEFNPQKTVSGIVIGLYCPDFMNSLNSTGWHFHFVSDDKSFGGHVLSMNLKEGEVEFDKIENFKMALPTNDDFDALNFKVDLKEQIHKAENETY